MKRMRKWFKPRIGLHSPEVHDDPYPFYDSLRREHPVFYDAAANFWLVSRYADVNAALKDIDVFSTRNASFENTLLGADGSAHTRMRRIVGRMFNTTRVAALVDAMRSLVDDAIDRIATSGKSEVIADLAKPLAVNTVSWLLESDSSRVQDLWRWSESLLTASGEIGRSDDALRVATSRITECHTFMREHMAKKLRAPDGFYLSSLMSDAEDRPTIDELLEIGPLLIVAGTETTTSLVGNALKILASDTDLQQVLRADVKLIPSFIEEVLRYESPVQHSFRLAKRATTIAGTTIPEGANVQLLIGAANRDPAQFRDPDQFQLNREPNNHVAFGFGPHFCLGGRLARLEASTVLEQLIRRLPLFLLSSDHDAVAMSPSFSVRGPSRLKVQFPAARLP
jgi:cytochrome P450